VKILTEVLNKFAFEDIQSFAKEGKAESVQLDYKKDFQTDEKMAQLITAFANTRGGVIVIGIGENRSNGTPISWDGIEDGRHEERVAQIMSGIHPVPAFEVYKTNAVNNRVFVLIRVFEGDETPYYPHNDSNLWIRTGSIKKSVEIASPEMAELLYKKAEKATLARKQNEKLATFNYDCYLVNREKEKKREAVEEASRLQIKEKPIEKNKTILEVLFQPYFPHKDFVKPQNTEQIIQDSYASNAVYSFPIRDMWESVDNGMIFFKDIDELICQQVFANGLICSSHEISRTTKRGRETHLGWLTGELFITLKGAKTYWRDLVIKVL